MNSEPATPDAQSEVALAPKTTTSSGLTVQSILDENEYEKGRRITDGQMAAINLRRHDFHGDGNYTISPSGKLQ